MNVCILPFPDLRFAKSSLKNPYIQMSQASEDRLRENVVL